MTTQESQQLILHPKKSSAISLLLCCSMFVALGLWIAQKESWIGYLGAGFFALGIPIAIVELLPGSSYLKIDEDGLTFASMFRVTKLSWSDINEFFVLSMKQSGVTVHKSVAFNYAPSFDRARIRRQLSSAIAGCEGELPDTYGKEAEELVESLNRCLAQFRNRDGEQSDPPKSRVGRQFGS